MTKEEQVTMWQQRLAWSKEYREPYAKSWEKSYELYKLDFGKTYSDNDTDFKVPFAYMHHSVKVPTIYTRMPKLIVKSTKSEDISTEDLVEKILKDIFKKSGFEDALRIICLTGIILNTAIVKIGYGITTEEQSVAEGTPFDEEMHSVDDEGVISEEIILEHGIWVDQVDSFDFFHDPEADKLESCRWVAHRLVLTEERYKKLFPGKEMYEESMEVEEGVKNYQNYKHNMDMQRYATSEDAKRPVVYEIWDKEHQKYYVVAKGSDTFLKETDWPYDKLKKYPFEILTFDDCPGTLYGLNTLYLQKDIIREKSLIKRRKVLNAKQCKSSTFYETGAFPDGGVDAYSENVDKGLIEVNEIAKIENVGTPPLPAEAFHIDMELDQLLGDTSGTTPEIRQQESKKRETATQVSTRNQNANIQTSAKGAKFERFVERISEKIIPLLKQFYTRPEELRIDGANAQYAKWVGTDIGEYTFSVKVGSAAWQDVGLKTQQLNNLLQLIGTMAQSGAIPNPKPVMQKILMAQFNLLDLPIEDIEEAFKQPDVPIIPPGQAGAAGTPGSQASQAQPAQGNRRQASTDMDIVQKLLQQRST